jgi:trk system potassium uptake protein TrkA
MKQQVVVIGLGRFGSAVARELVRLGHDVLGVDSDLSVVQRLSADLSHVVQAEATDEETLTRLGVPRVVVKARNETHGEILERVGADRVAYPERDTGVRLAHSWTSMAITDSLDVVEGYAISKVAVPAAIVGKTVGEAIMAPNFGVTLVLLARGPRVTVYPPSDVRLAAGDVLVMGGELAEMERFFSSIR